MAKIGKSNKALAKRRVKRQKAVMTAKQVKAVKKIAVAAVAKKEETKFFKYQTEVEPPFGVPQSWNLFYYGVSRGTNENQIIGNKFNWRGIKIKYRVQNLYLDGVTFVWHTQPLTFDIYIISTSKYYTNSNLALSELRNDTTTDINTFFFNENVKVHFKRTVTLNPSRLSTDNNANTTRQVKTGTIWVKKNQMLEYLDLDTTYDLKKGINYYMVLHNRSAYQTKPNINLAWQNYFKDS